MKLSGIIDLVAYADLIRGIAWAGVTVGILIFALGAACLLYRWLERDHRTDETIGLTLALSGDQRSADVLQFPTHNRRN
jgi:hypothetical protein